MMKHRLTIFLFIILLCRQAYPLLEDTSIDPLRPEVGARPLGMGAGFVALADDMNAALYNPAGLAWVKGISLTVQDLNNLAAAQAYPTGNNSALGLAVVTSKITDIPLPSGAATLNSNVVVLSYGTKLFFLPALYQQEAFQRVGLGMSIKTLLGQTLRQTGQMDRSATGWDVDLGMLWKGSDWWSIGATAQNILPAGTFGGGEIKWDSGSTEEARTFYKLGMQGHLIGDLGCPIYMEGRELNLGWELGLSDFSPLLLRLGGEFGVNKTYYIRAGIMQQWKAGSAVTGHLGLGYRLGEWGMDLASYRDQTRDQSVLCFTVLYLPKEWVIVRQLEVDRASLLLERPFEAISIEDNLITYDDRIEVTGKVKPGVEVFVNDLRAATADDNLFKVTVPLQLEKNLIVVEARYQGEKKTWKYKILRKAKIVLAEEKAIKSEIEKARTAQQKEALLQQEKAITEQKQKVEELVTMGVIEVTPEAEFKLNVSVTRGELATWLVKSTGWRLPRVEKDLFSDVKRDNPLAPYIKLVVDWDLLRPFPDGTFRPDAPVTKEEGEKLSRLLMKVQR